MVVAVIVSVASFSGKEGARYAISLLKQSVNNQKIFNANQKLLTIKVDSLLANQHQFIFSDDQEKKNMWTAINNNKEEIEYVDKKTDDNSSAITSNTRTLITQSEMISKLNRSQ